MLFRSDGKVVGHMRQWYDVVHLALQTDSTRVISVGLETYTSGVEGVTLTNHDASHHGKDPEKISQLTLIEEAKVKLFGEFLDKLQQSAEGSGSLLDRTTVLLTSSMGDASSHSNDNLPIILAGGGYKHQGHVAYDTKNNTLLSNLFVRILHQMDIEATSFGASDGVINVV